MVKRPISYTSRDFESIKDDLVNYAKRYYPSTFKDFNEASFGALMLDLVAYVGDQLSFYTDYQANESFLDSAIEFKNIVRLSKQLGYQMPGSPQATGVCEFFITVPAASDKQGPDANYLPILERGAILGSTGGGYYTLNEDVDFSRSTNPVTVATVDPDTGVPLKFAIKSYGSVVSGRQGEELITVGDYERFLQLNLETKNISEILSVKDSQGNEYYQVEHLTEDVIYNETPNFTSTRGAVPYILTAVPAPRRFVTRFNQNRNTFIQFGYGSADNLTGDVIADPADVVLNVSGRKYISDETFDPTNLIKTDKFGVVPTNTTLTIEYVANSSETINAPVDTINTAVIPSFIFANEASLSTSTIEDIRQSLQVGNSRPILGDTESITGEEIRVRAYATYASQNRAVTAADYVNLAYRMPAKFGSIKRVSLIQDINSFKRNLNMYVLAENSEGNFIAPNLTLKKNLKAWIGTRRMINDTIDILDGKIINYGINFEVLPELDINKYELLQRCTEKLKDKLKVKKGIGDPVYISEIYKFLNDVPGVIDTTNVELINKAGGNYSNFIYNVDTNLSDDGRYWVIPPSAAAEILFPDSDIAGVVK
jgi:hypothetical protein